MRRHSLQDDGTRGALCSYVTLWLPEGSWGVGVHGNRLRFEVHLWGAHVFIGDNLLPLRTSLLLSTRHPLSIYLPTLLPCEVPRATPAALPWWDLSGSGCSSSCRGASSQLGLPSLHCLLCARGHQLIGPVIQAIGPWCWWAPHWGQQRTEHYLLSMLSLF